MFENENHLGASRFPAEPQPQNSKRPASKPSERQIQSGIMNLIGEDADPQLVQWLTKVIRGE